MLLLKLKLNQTETHERKAAIKRRLKAITRVSADVQGSSICPESSPKDQKRRNFAYSQSRELKTSKFSFVMPTHENS